MKILLNGTDRSSWHEILMVTLAGMVEYTLGEQMRRMLVLDGKLKREPLIIEDPRRAADMLLHVLTPRMRQGIEIAQLMRDFRDYPEKVLFVLLWSDRDKLFSGKNADGMELFLDMAKDMGIPHESWEGSETMASSMKDLSDQLSERYYPIDEGNVAETVKLDAEIESYATSESVDVKSEDDTFILEQLEKYNKHMASLLNFDLMEERRSELDVETLLAITVLGRLILKQLKWQRDEIVRKTVETETDTSANEENETSIIANNEICRIDNWREFIRDATNGTAVYKNMYLITTNEKPEALASSLSDADIREYIDKGYVYQIEMPLEDMKNKWWKR